MKRLFFYPPPLSLVLLAFLLFDVSSNFLLGEGSRDFRDYPGHRLFYNVEQNQQLKVYATAGEFINVGSSHVGINGGFIEVYDPMGNRRATFNGNTGNVAIIFDNIQEMAGPTGGGSSQGEGYVPGVVAVTEGMDGVWTIRLGYPNPFRNSFTSELLNSSDWKREDHQPDGPRDQRVALAWDVTVTQGGAGNEGGAWLEGRLYSNEFISILDGNGTIANPRSTSPTFFVLTLDGYIYSVNFNETDPWGFPIISNSRGITNADFSPTYRSAPDSVGAYIRSGNPDSWQDGNLYLYDPQAKDLESISNNKIFFNTPHPSLPFSAMVTDINSAENEPHLTWLLNEVPIESAENQFITFKGLIPPNSPCREELEAEVGKGGYFIFDSELGGQATLSIDINGDGDYSDDVDVVLSATVEAGIDSVLWEGNNGLGEAVPAGEFMFEYDLTIRGGEIHILLLDVENNAGGVTFTRTNGPDSPDATFYYDHSLIDGGGVSGGGSSGNALPTTVPFTYSDSFGDNKLLDQWAFIETNNFGTGMFTITVKEDCEPNDNDEDGIPDFVDIDDDNDGVPDLLEFCHPEETWACLPGGLDPSGDEDSDGIQNYQDADDPGYVNSCTDENSDGICDQIPTVFDADGDNIPDHFDLDSDNDGITDLVEAGHRQADDDGDGVIDGENTAFGENGLFDPLETEDTPEGEANYTPWDFDGDGIPDHDDLDSDNDGITDVIEAGHNQPDTDQDGRIDFETVSTGGIVDGLDPALTGTGIPLPIDWDSDKVPDWHDLDSDNDGILDVIEGGYQGSDTNLDGRIDDGSGNIPNVNSDGLPPVMDPDSTGSPINNPPDTDSDEVPDYHDLDSDNDGINGTIENLNPDGDEDGFIGTGPVEVDINGIAVADANGPLQPYTPLVNTDMDTGMNPSGMETDGIPDFRDLDVDGDSLTDVIEGGLGDPDEDGIIGTGVPVVNTFGQATEGTTSTPPNTDGEGPPDFQQFDNVCMKPDTPTIEVTGGDNEACAGESVMLSATGSTGSDLTYEWTHTTEGGVATVVGTTTSPSLLLDSIMPSDAGTYTLVVSQDTCVSDISNSIELVVRVHPEKPTITVDNDRPCLEEGFTLSTEAVSGGNISYDWLLDGVVVSNTNQPELPVTSASPANSGNYTVVVNNGGCPSEPSDPVSVIAQPVVNGDISIDPTSGFCEGTSITLTAPSVEGASYAWSGPNDFSSSEPTVTFESASPDNSGDYSVVIRVDQCSTALGPVNLDIQPKPATPTVASDKESVCPGDSVTLTTDEATGDNITYDWLQNGAVVNTSDAPSFEISNFQEANAGDYTVVVKEGDCPSDPSESVSISTKEAPEGATASANSPVCIDDPINLTVTEISGATYEWKGPDDFSSTERNPTIENATTANGGDYTVTLTVEGCPVDLPPINVEVVPKPPAPTVTIEEGPVCEGNTVTISVTEPADVPEGTTFSVLDTAGNVVGTSNTATIEINTEGMAGTNTYTVISQESNACPSEPSNPVSLEVTPKPEETAMILEPEEDVACGEVPLTIEAVEPAEGTGTWTSDDPDIGFTDPNSPLSGISGLSEGENIITWTLSNALCGDYASDQITITINTPETIANDDEFMILNTERVENGNIIGNDQTSGGSITIISGPSNGTATVNGTAINYTPDENFGGNDQLVYELCDTECPESCDQATVTFSVTISDCIIPDVISPNSDGLNDALVIPCSDFKNVSIKIFNRWGDQVYESENYRNDWMGTHDGEPLPPGPYYYIFEEEGAAPVTGYVAIAR